MITQICGKWMRIGVVDRRNAATNEIEKTHEEFIHIETGMRVKQFFGNACFLTPTGDLVDTNEDFEVVGMLLMASEGPQPPQPRPYPFPSVAE